MVWVHIARFQKYVKHTALLTMLLNQIAQAGIVNCDLHVHSVAHLVSKLVVCWYTLGSVCTQWS